MNPAASKLEQARQLMESGRAAEAAAILQRAFQQSPRDPAICNGLSLVMMALGQHQQAVFYVQRAVPLMP